MPRSGDVRRVLDLAMRGGVVRRSLWAALIVGTILTAINQGDALLGGGGFSLLKAALTYCVPYCVATFGAVSALTGDAALPGDTELTDADA